MTAKINRLAPKNVESFIVIKENKIIIEGHERHDDPEEFFNGERDTEKEEDLMYLED